MSLFSLITLNNFKTSHIRSFLFGITLACSGVCCQRTELEIRFFEIFLSLFKWLYIIKGIVLKKKQSKNLHKSNFF